MLMPTKNRQMIYEYLFKEGVLVAKKDFQAPKHPEIEVPNLQVIKTLQVNTLLCLFDVDSQILYTRRKHYRIGTTPVFTE